MLLDKQLLDDFRKVMEEVLQGTFSADIVLGDEFLISLIELAKSYFVTKEQLLNPSYVKEVLSRGLATIPKKSRFKVFL